MVGGRTGEPGVAVEAAGAGFEHSCDRGGAAVLRREVGHDLGVVQVDPDDSMSVAARVRRALRRRCPKRSR